MGSCLKVNVMMCLYVFLFVYAVFTEEVAVDAKTPDTDSTVFNAEPGKRESDNLGVDSMVMDQPLQPYRDVCSPNVNCIFKVYNDQHVIISTNVFCGRCIEGYDCAFESDDESQCMLIFKCKMNATEESGSNATERTGRKDALDEKQWPRVLDLSKEVTSERTGKQLSSCRPNNRQERIADAHEL